jgi:hypothetical protein
MGWPFNGTRRWYLSQRLHNPDATGDYLGITGRRQAELHSMIFAHGVRYLIVPLFGTQLLERGEDYVRYALSGLTILRDDAAYQQLYAEGVRVRFYGDYRQKLVDRDYSDVLEACEDLSNSTSTGDGPLLLFGLFADDPHPTLARLSVEFNSAHGRPPNREELIRAYYGADVPGLSLYLGFAQHTLFDVPLLPTGLEDLYTTLNPSPDLTMTQLREILYDHLVTRRFPEMDYGNLSAEGQAALAAYSERWTGVTLGLGRIDPLSRVWVPSLPPKLQE